MILETQKILTIRAETKGDTDLILALAVLAKEYLPLKKSLVEIQNFSIKKERIERFANSIIEKVV